MRRAAPALVALALVGCGGASRARAPAATPVPTAEPGAALDIGTAPSPLAVRLEDPRDTVAYAPEKPPRAGVLFDLDTGQVLWRRNPTQPLPIASLTKMMTALLVDERLSPGARVPITKAALRYSGSGVGLLPKGKKVTVGTLLHGLLLPSGNDAARALALRAGSGSIARFVRGMNRRAAELGLACTHFTSPDGLRDDGRSCAADLAAMGRAVLRSPRLAAIVRRRNAILPFPIKGRKLYLYNTNPLLRTRYPGTTGVKTGYTVAAGQCIVATARRGAVELGVVLLHSPNSGQQARALLDRGFRAELG